MLVITPPGVNRRWCGAFTRAHCDSNDMAPKGVSLRKERREI
jgi:hypothetical protein